MFAPSQQHSVGLCAALEVLSRLRVLLLLMLLQVLVCELMQNLLGAARQVCCALMLLTLQLCKLGHKVRQDS